MSVPYILNTINNLTIVVICGRHSKMRRTYSTNSGELSGEVVLGDSGEHPVNSRLVVIDNTFAFGVIGILG